MTDSGAGADPWLGGRLRLRQPPRGAHRAGTDAVLLSRLLAPGPGALVCDLGSGPGAVGLAVASLHPGCRVVLVENDAGFADLARANAALNGLAGRVLILEADILAGGAARHAAGLVPAMADIVLTNPPFFDRARHRPSPIAERRVAHSFGGDDLDTWMRTGVDVLKDGGRLGLIHRADALHPCLDALRNRFGDLAIRPVHARADRPAIRILITATKGSRGPTDLLPPLVLQTADGRFTTDVEALHRGEPCGEIHRTRCGDTL